MMPSTTKAVSGRPDPIREKILDIIAEQGMVERELLQPQATLDDLGLQSIDIVMVLNEIEEQFDIYVPIDQSISDVSNVDSLVSHIASLVKSSQETTPLTRDSVPKPAVE